MNSLEAKNTLTANLQTLDLLCAGYAGVAFQFVGTWVATVSFEGTVDGSTWVPLTLLNAAGASVTSATANGVYAGSCAGLTKVRARVTAFTSGSAVVTGRTVESAAAGASAGGGGGGPVSITGPIGAAPMASAIPVTIATDQPPIPVQAQVNSSNFWAASDAPLTNVRATVTKAAAGGGIRNVCTGFVVTLAALSTAPAAVQLSVALIDGGSGGGTYLWRTVISLPAVAGAITAFVKDRMWMPGTVATAMTLEFSVAGGLNTIQSVSMEGTTSTT